MYAGTVDRQCSRLAGADSESELRCREALGTNGGSETITNIDGYRVYVFSSSTCSRTSDRGRMCVSESYKASFERSEISAIAVLFSSMRAGPFATNTRLLSAV